MKKELQEKLYNQFPKLFAQKDLDMKRTSSKRNGNKGTKLVRKNMQHFMKQQKLSDSDGIIR